MSCDLAMSSDSLRSAMNPATQPTHLRRQGYDTLQADPDFLISGPFSQWVSLYDPAVIRDSFLRVAAFGQYVIYKRAR